MAADLSNPIINSPYDPPEAHFEIGPNRPTAAQSGIALAVSREHARVLALWAQKTALAYELTSDTDRAGTAAMGQEVRSGRPLRGSQVWAARNARDSDIGVALAQIDVSATPVP